MFKVNREELAWAGGLFSGEGTTCLTAPTRKGKEIRRYPRMSVYMNSEDGIERLVDALPIGNERGPYINNGKEQWRWEVSGYKDVSATVAVLWPFLTEEKQDQAHRVLSHYLKDENAINR